MLFTGCGLDVKEPYRFAFFFYLGVACAIQNSHKKIIAWVYTKAP
jgi:hypothetical protein